MGERSVLFIASDYKPKPGGRADYIDNLARGLRSIGCPTRVLAVVRKHRMERLAFLRHYEDWVIPFPVVYEERPRKYVSNKCVSALEIARCLSPKARRVLERTSIFRASVASLAGLERVLEGERPSLVVFGHLDMRLYSFALCLLERGQPYAVIAHDSEVCLKRDRINDRVRRGLVLKGAKLVAANSGYTKSQVEAWGIASERIRVVHPPISGEAMTRSANSASAGTRADGLSLVTFCRLVSGKGIDIVLRALKILDSSGVPFRYAIGGDGPERRRLETLVGDLGLQRRVSFLGTVSNDKKWEALQNSDVYVMPSRSESTWFEGFGIAFIEAAAFGLPAVGTRVGGIPDAVVNGETGILVRPESPGEVADALTFLYQNPEIRIEMGRTGMERARSQFTPAAVATRFLGAVSECA